MNEPRKLNTGVARHINRAGASQGQAPRPAAAPADAPATEEPLREWESSPAAAPAEPQPAPVTPPQGNPMAPRRSQPVQRDAYAAARRRAQASADQSARRRAQASADQSARLRRSQQLPRVSTTRELSPEERRAIAQGLARKQGTPAADPAAQTRVAAPARPAAAASGAAPRTITTSASRHAAPESAPQAPAHSPRTETPKEDSRADAIAQLYPSARENGKKEPAAGKKSAGAGKPAKNSRPKGGGSGAPPRKNGKKAPAGGSGGKPKKKKKGRWWKVLLIVVLILVLIFGAVYALISHAIAPSSMGGGTGIGLNNMFNTPKEYQGKELNFLMVGIDRSAESGDKEADAYVNDGMTDMILYVHFNNETGEMKLLQIPRDYLVTTSRRVSSNFCLNGVATTQATEANSLNMTALMEQVSNMFQIPIDGYVSIRMEMLVQLVDALGPIEMYIPQDLEYNHSKLEKGYRFLTGEQVEFFLRNRHSFATSDFGRLDNQRQFYSAMFRRLKNMDNIWDVAKVAPVVLSYTETDMPLSDLVSFAISVLRMDSSKIMLCRMPAYMMGSRNYWDGRGTYETNSKSVDYPARKEAAELLNEYFRENTGPVDASELQLCEPTSDAMGAFGVKSEMTLMPANIQFLHDINVQQDEAKLNDNPDGLYFIEYTEPTAAPTEAPAASEPAA